MVDIPFIKDPTALQVIQAVIDLAGANFQPPYSGGEQPYNAANFNAETLLQYSLPGGTIAAPTVDPADADSVGSAINSVIGAVSYFISAYGLILPIIGVIRGIIEILCAMMNPFAVIRAVIRLFTKWLPPFIALFPALAGVIIIINTIKLVLSVVYFILSELVATYELIKVNIRLVQDAVNDANTARAEAGREKLEKVLLILLNKLGVMAILEPLLQIILFILDAASGFPCGKGDTDSSCCDEGVCPDVIKNPPSSNDPSGVGRLLPGFFGEFVPGFVYRLFTNNDRVSELNKYNSSVVDQINPQLDEEISAACPPGADSPCPMFRVKITSRRGGGREVVANAVRINGSVITIFDPSARLMLGQVNYEIIPNYEMLIMSNMIGLACHPDVEAAKASATPLEDLDTPICEKLPEACAALGDASNLKSELDSSLNNLGDILNEVNVDQDNYDDQISRIQNLQDDSVALLSNFADRLRNALRSTLAQVSNKLYSDFEVDRNIVKADGVSIATLAITPRDGAGAVLTKNLPDGVDMAIEFITDFGIISNQRTDNSTGQILADIVSATPGTATCRAKINTDFVSERSGTTDSIKEVQVKFVADATLPVRRRVSTPNKGETSKGTSRAPTGSDSEREPRR